MFELLKKRIESKAYKLEKTLDLIDEMEVKEKITKEEADELYGLARENAKAENSYASVETRMQDMYSRMTNLESRVDKLEGKGQENPEEPTEPTNEYPEYKQPTGSHDSYNTGNKVTYNGKKYICKMDNCVWSPDTYPAGWEEVIEEAEESEVE